MALRNEMTVEASGEGVGILEETLSDGSKAYNVVIRVEDEDGGVRTVRVACVHAKAAYALYGALRAEAVASIELV